MRQTHAIRSNYGKLMILIGSCVAIPLVVLPFYPAETLHLLAFALPAGGSILIGSLVCLFGKHKEGTAEKQPSLQNSNFTVLFAWSWGTLVGAFPFFWGKQLGFVQALFEAVSGWTTTGLSVMDVTVTPQIFLFHRSFMQYCGGLGFVMVMVMLVQDRQSMNLFNAEGHPDKLMPSLRKTAQTICLMYSAFLAIGTVAYWLAGMSVFDALLHAMCSLSTGGFSTKLNSIGEYSSLAIEMITILLMLIGTTNFAVLLLLAKRKWRQVIRVSEVKFMFLLLLVFTPLTTFSLMQGMHMETGQGLRHALFNVASALSTTGYSTMGYTSWPPLAISILILLMLIGGGIGSTAGGIKLSRVYLVLRIVLQNIRKRIFPTRQIEAPSYIKAQGKAPIDVALILDTFGFVGCYSILFIIGTACMLLATGCSLTEAMFEFASALGTVGLSIGLTGPATTSATLIVEMFGMLLGRLEIFIVLIGIYGAVTKLNIRIDRVVHKSLSSKTQ